MACAPKDGVDSPRLPVQLPRPAPHATSATSVRLLQLLVHGDLLKTPRARAIIKWQQTAAAESPRLGGS